MIQGTLDTLLPRNITTAALLIADYICVSLIRFPLVHVRHVRGSNKSVPTKFRIHKIRLLFYSRRRHFSIKRKKNKQHSRLLSIIHWHNFQRDELRARARTRQINW